MSAHPSCVSILGRLWCVLACLWLVSMAAPARAGTAALVVDPELERQSLDGHVDVLIDPSGELELNDVRASPDWAEVGPQPYARGLEPGVVWLRFALQNSTKLPVDRLLKISSGHIDEITVWMDKDGELQRFEAGEDVARSERAVHHFFPLFPMPIEPGEKVLVTARLVDEGLMSVGIKLYERDAAQAFLERRQWISGLMTGMFALVALYSLVLYRRVRDPMMGWMTALALASLFQWLALYGTNVATLLPVESRGWTINRLIVVAYELSAFFSFYFYMVSCQSQRHHPLVSRVIQGFGWLGLANALAVFFIPYVPAIRILYLGTIGLLLTAGMVIWRARCGDRIAKRLVLAVGVLLVGYLATMLTEEGFLPRWWASGHYVAIATVAQWLLLSEVLAFRVRQLEKNRREARKAQKAEERRTEQLRTAFGRYVAPELAAKLLEDPEAMALGGRMQTITILMSDLRGFTGLTDRLGPPAMCALLNDYLGRMTEVIERHGGMVNEFIGDAILTLFGTPFKGPEDELAACRCAIEMQLELERMNVELEAKHGIRLEMGIGIHTGEAVVGNIGSERRVKWGVIGDTVNMTARIESLTVGTQVLMSSRVLGCVATDVDTGPVRSVYVKGRDHTLVVAELRAIRDEALCMPVPPERPSRPVALEGMVQIFAGKELLGQDYAVDVVALGRNELTFHGTRRFRIGTDVALRLRRADDSFMPPIYVKLLDRGEPIEDGRLEMRATITWMEPEVRASLLGLAS